MKDLILRLPLVLLVLEEIRSREGRLNKFTVNKVAIGLSRFLLKQHKTPSAVIHYDTRHLSPEFAQIIANVLASHDITVYLSDTYRTTPDLSYAVRYLEADAGVMITASHNPKDYNGIKVYGADGGQLSTEPSNKLSNIIAQLGDPLSILMKTLEIKQRIFMLYQLRCVTITLMMFNDS